MIIDAVTVLVTIFIGIYVYSKWRFQYWKKIGVPYLEPVFPFGNLQNPTRRKKPLSLILTEYYNIFKLRGYKHGGIFFFNQPFYIPINPEYVKHIMTRDFAHFMDRGMAYDEKRDPLSAHLFNLEGQRWKVLRAKLTPTFTSGKLKSMFQTMVDCGIQMIACVDQLAEQKQIMDVKEICGRYTTDIIGSCAFGIDCNSFRDGENEFRENGRKIFEPLSKFEQLKSSVAFTFPPLAKYFALNMLRSEPREFFFNAVKETVRFREETDFRRNDFMQLLIDLKNDKHESNEVAASNLTIEQVAAQAFVFFLAGFETSSTTMTFCLFELALNCEIQNKLRKNIKETMQKHNNKITYEAIMQMEYLSQVVDETLRKYPPVSSIPRICVQDYQIPDTDVTIKKGTRILIPALGLQRDPDYFPDPEKFDPDRFSEERKHHIRPYTYLPFGEGPRICIGNRFGSMQTKVGLAILLQNYKFKLNERTQLPLMFNPRSFVLVAKEGIWLDVEKV